MMGISIFFLILTLSTFFHFGIQKVFIYYKKFDDFNHRSSHKTLATRTGGIGIFAMLFFISLFFYFDNNEIYDFSLLIPLGIMFFIGVYDDFYKADFKLKFFFQIIVAKILIDQGYVITNYYGLFGIDNIPWLIAQLTTVFIFLVVINSINFIDGIDGLAITEFIKIFVLIEYFKNNGSNQMLSLGFFVITSLIPLYYFNLKKKRKIFLGDGGSLLLGTIVMVFLLSLLNEKTIVDEGINKFMLSITILIYPLIDTLRVFILRLKNGKSPFLADNNHIHHKLLNMGLAHYQIVLLIEVISILPILFFI